MLFLSNYTTLSACVHASVVHVCMCACGCWCVGGDGGQVWRVNTVPFFYLSLFRAAFHPKCSSQEPRGPARWTHTLGFPYASLLHLESGWLCQHCSIRSCLLPASPGCVLSMRYLFIHHLLLLHPAGLLLHFICRDVDCSSI